MAKLLCVLLVPVLVVLNIKHKLSPISCFSPMSVPVPAVTKLLSDNLDSQYKQIQNLSPLVQLGDSWFKYNVSLRNNFKWAVVIDEANFYEEATGTIMLKTSTNNNVSNIDFGEDEIIAEGISLKQIPGLIASSTFSGSFKTDSNNSVPPNSILKVQTNADWPICISITLQKNNLVYVYLIFLIFEISLLVLIREITTFVDKNFSDYMKSK